MKKITLFKKLFALCTLFFAVQITAQIQNPYWTFPPNYSADPPTGTYSVLPGGITYSGVYPHNMYADASGKPVLFVVDGVVYNRTGDIISTLAAPSASGYVEGRDEVCIVPDPGSCTRYYIFTSANYGDPGARPVYAYIDVAQTNTVTGVVGKNITSSPVSGGNVFDLYTITPPPFGYTACEDLNANWAVTKPNANDNGSRLVFFANGDYYYIYKISTSGVSYLSQISYNNINTSTGGNSAASATLHTELELYEDANDKIKMALAVPRSAGLGDLSLNTVSYPSPYTAVTYTPASGVTVIVPSCSINPILDSRTYGIEFSPNGKWVIFSHDPTPCYPSTVEAVNFTNTTRVSLSTDAGFEAGQIEMGADTAVYVAGNVGSGGYVYKLTTPSNPSATNFTTSIGLSGYTAKYMPDQMDHDVYGTSFNSSISCCMFYQNYDKFTYQAQGSSHVQVWKPNTSTTTYNPVALSTNTTSTVTIGQELRIPAGYTVTIQNMTIKFTPQATFIVEGQSGATNAAKLVLKKCTLDVDTRCQTKMWPGVRVWGDTLSARSTVSKGYLIIDSMSVITNAWVGVELGYNTTYAATYLLPKPIDTLRAGGGNIACISSSFINNQRDIVFDRHQLSTGGISNLLSSNFMTTAYLLGGTATPICHIQLSDYKPQAQIKGDLITCSTSLTHSGYAVGYKGLISINSNYYINDNSVPAGNSIFSNLSFGISATNTGSNLATITVVNTTFSEVSTGIYTGLINNSTLESDSFRIYSYAGGNRVGIYLDNCTGYWVQDNYFTNGGLCLGSCFTPSNRYGVLVNNSGASVNSVFRNTFTNLYKGSQAQFVNYTSTAGGVLNGAGLLYMCNQFITNTISKADIYVPANNSSANISSCPTCTANPAGIQNSQGAAGSATPPNRPTADNQFSHTSGANDFYIEPPGTTTLTLPSNYYYYCPVGTLTATCASSTYTASVYKPDNTLTTSNTFLTPYTLTVTPDCSTGGNGHRDALTPLESALQEATADKQIYDNLKNTYDQGNYSDLYVLSLEMSNAFADRHRALDRAIRILLNNNDDTSEVQAKAILKEKALELPPREQLETALAINDQQMASQALAQVTQKEGSSNYVKLHNILLQNNGKSVQEIMANSSNRNKVIAIGQDSSDRRSFLKARILLQAAGISDYQPYIQPDAKDIPKGKSAHNQNDLSEGNDLFNAPNPFGQNTTIKATVSQTTDNAYVVVTDMMGKEVAKYKLQQGDNNIIFDASNIDAQVFFCTLTIDGVKIRTNKMVLIK